MYQVGVYAMWLGLLFDTNATLQGDGDAFWEESDAFCIAGVAFFRGVMHLGRSVMHWGLSVFHWGWRVMSDAFIVHEMGQGSVASSVHEMGTPAADRCASTDSKHRIGNYHDASCDNSEQENVLRCADLLFHYYTPADHHQDRINSKERIG